MVENFVSVTDEKSKFLHLRCRVGVVHAGDHYFPMSERLSDMLIEIVVSGEGCH